MLMSNIAINSNHLFPASGTPYRHSGRAPLTGLLCCYLLGLLVAVASGMGYSFAVSNLQLALAEAVLFLLFAALVGVSVGLVAKTTKIRSPRQTTLCALFCATTGLYCYWASHPFFALGPEHQYIAWSPAQIYQWALLLFDKGGEFSGWLAVTLWLLEAAGLFLMSVGMANLQVENAFCENCDCWTENREGVAYFKHPGKNSLLARRLNQNDCLALAECSPASHQTNNYLQVDMDMCPACLQICIVHCKQVATVINRRMKKEKKEFPLIQKTFIKPEELKTIIAASQI